MIVPIQLGCILWKKNLTFPRFLIWSKLSLEKILRGFDLIMQKNLLPVFLLSFFQKQGTVHESLGVDTPQQNGIAEWKNKHLLEIAKALLFQSNVLKPLSEEAFLDVAYAINRLPSRVISNQNAISILFNFILRVSIQVIGPEKPLVVLCSFIYINNIALS